MNNYVRVIPPSLQKAIRRPEDLATELRAEFDGETREKVMVAVMDGALHITQVRTIAYGSAVKCLFPLREILHAVLVADGVAFAVAHNHPSGDVAFSPEDLRSTKDAMKAARTVDLRFVDHILIGRQGKWASALELALIPSLPDRYRSESVVASGSRMSIAFEYTPTEALQFEHFSIHNAVKAQLACPEGTCEAYKDIFTYKRWVAQGFVVRKGEKGKRVTTWIPIKQPDRDGKQPDRDGKPVPKGRRPKQAILFCRHQVEEK